MVGTYAVELSQNDSIGVLPVFDYVANEILAATEFEEIAMQFANYWRNRLAYVLSIPGDRSIHYEIEAKTWEIVDQAAEAIRLGPYEREIMRTINWEIHRQQSNSRKHLSPERYKTLLHTKGQYNSKKS